jgi:hypothetical protein
MGHSFISQELKTPVPDKKEGWPGPDCRGFSPLHRGFAGFVKGGGKG